MWLKPLISIAWYVMVPQTYFDLEFQSLNDAFELETVIL